MRLYVLSDYKNRELSYQTGDVIEVDFDTAEFLMRDAPGCFSYEPPLKAMEAPPKDKMIGAPDYKKMTVPELKDELKVKGLPVGGNKSELIERLENA